MREGTALQQPSLIINSSTTSALRTRTEDSASSDLRHVSLAVGNVGLTYGFAIQHSRLSSFVSHLILVDDEHA